MSTIATTNLKHPSSAVNNMVLSSNGNVIAATKFIGAGLDHIVTQSFSSASTISINNCFSSNYENYRLMITATNSSSVPTFLRFRSSLADNSTSNYWTLGTYTGQTTNPSAYRVIPGSYFDLGGQLANNSYGFFVDIFSPFSSTSTTSASAIVIANNGTEFYGISAAYKFNSSTSFDGLTLYPNSGVFSGTVRIYGYENT